MVSGQEHPFRITVYNKAYVRQGWIGDLISLGVQVTHNGLGEASLTLGASDAKIPILRDTGARVTIDYLDEPLLSGKIRAKSGTGPGTDGTMTFTVVDDLRLLYRVLGWPVPGAAITAQNTSEYHTVSGPAETVLKTVVTANAVTRLGEPVTVAASLGRGSTITAAFRFHPLADRLFPAVDAAGIGVTVRQQGAGLLLDCYVPELHPRTLTEAGGVITDWSWSQADAEATHVVVGGQGEGTARTFAAYSDAARVTDLGERIEVFRDARDTGSGSVYSQRATETFAETAPKSGLSVKFSETSVFRYGGPGGVRVGDKVTLQVGSGLEITDTLRSAAFSWTRDNGLEVTPAIGDITDNTDSKFAKAIAAIAAGVRDLRRK
jgi:hypothetical protein